MVIVGWAANWLMTSYFTRRSSASWMTVAGAIVGGLIGSLLLGALPLIGSLVGAVIGGVAGVILVELLPCAPAAITWSAAHSAKWSSCASRC